MRVKIHRATSKKPRRLWGLDGGAGVLRAKIVIFAYSGRRAAPAAGAQRLLRAPKARAWRAERRRRERVQPPGGVNFCLHASQGDLTFFCDFFIFGGAQRRCRRAASAASAEREHGGASAAGASVFDHPQGYNTLSSERSERRRKQTARAQRGSFALTRRSIPRS